MQWPKLIILFFPLDDDEQEPYVHLLNSYDCGNRELYYVYDYLVDMFFSLYDTSLRNSSQIKQSLDYYKDGSIKLSTTLQILFPFFIFLNMIQTSFQKFHPKRKSPSFSYLWIKNRHIFHCPHRILTSFSQNPTLWTISMHRMLQLWINYEKPLHLLLLFDIIFVFSL